MKTINILVADHSETSRKELAEFFDKRKDMNLVDSVDNGQDACESIIHKQPDLVLLDVVPVSYTHLTLPTKLEV